MPDVSLHSVLQLSGARWLKDHGFPLVQIESHTVRKEHPDVIGFSLAYFAIIECKASRADFLRDKGKISRQEPEALGNFRFYLAPEGIIDESEIPSGWMLLEYSEGKAKLKGYHPAARPAIIAEMKPVLLNRTDLKGERDILYSLAIRRKTDGKSPYNK